ncbi:folate-binding protein YgfZ [Parasphingopyxis algicola]|uniref:CAF17-like 4Fe-4S cluster assembly/insertion protein YgfZ n=1 Tax=Parasphingopyxis algicola TaxID=2026624 RepID=UPI0015A291F8|nr:folate-binding protein YgfZ [Parasphingopyxis algicola]QLC25962.1 folate-binding protein YgfZ [Parasphingopyxis algicola]
MAATTLSDRALIRLSGDNVREFLQGLVTQNVDRVQPDTPQWTALLTAQGKALFDFLLWADGADILVDCEAEAADDLAKRLALYRLRRPIEIARDDALAVHWSPDASARPPDPRLAALGHRWLAPASEPAEGWRAHRLALGVTEGIAELGSDKTLWLECNAEELNGVDFEKGCYVGQENTARMHYRNKVNRRLVIVPRDRADEKRQRIAYPDLGLSVEHRRVEDLAGLDLPDWLASAIAAPVS